MITKEITGEGEVRDYYPEGGTSFRGAIEEKYENLVAIFGEPSREGSGDNKVQCQWIIMTPTEVATIYNWKDGKNYDEENGLENEDITDWHIGGRETTVVGYIKMAIAKYHEEINK